MVKPVLQEIAYEKPDTLSVVELNIDQNPVTPRTYGILPVPPMNLYRDGEVVVQIVGAQPKAAILHTIEDYL
jgi:thioredoxin